MNLTNENPVPEVDRSWEVIENWLRAHNPSKLDRLNPPAAPELIESLEAHLATELPQDLKAFLNIRNGTKSVLLFDGKDAVRVLPVEEIQRHYDFRNENSDQLKEAFARRRIEFDETAIPVLGYPNGDLSCLERSSGRLKFQSHNGGKGRSFAGFAYFLGHLARNLESGRYYLNKKGLIKSRRLKDLWMEISKFPHFPQFKELIRPSCGYGKLYRYFMDFYGPERAKSRLRKFENGRSLLQWFSMHNGQIGNFLLFFNDIENFKLLSLEESLHLLNDADQTDQYRFPVLQNGSTVIWFSTRAGKLYWNNEQLEDDLIDFLLFYLACLKNGHFEIGRNEISYKRFE